MKTIDLTHLTSDEVEIKSDILENTSFKKIAIMSDADVDGNHIFGLLIHFFYKHWYELFENNRVCRIISPLYIVKNGKKIQRFYTKKDYSAWEKNVDDIKKYDIKYIKGLGSLDFDEYKYMLEHPQEIFVCNDEKSEESLNIAFGKESQLRKDWLS